MLQNTYFCAPNPQSQAYIHYQGTNLYPMNLIYAPTSPSYFLISDFQTNLVHQLFNKNTFEQINHQNQQPQTQNNSSVSLQTHKNVKIQTNNPSSHCQPNQNHLIQIKIQQIESNQHKCLQKNIKMPTQKSSQIQDLKNSKPIQKQQKPLYTRKATQEISKTGRSLWWKQMDEQAQLDAIGMIKQFSKELIIYILKNQDSKGDTFCSVKKEISELISKRLNKGRERIAESLDLIVKILSTKFSKFKKTKEQMIKYIFRRIFNTKNKPDEITQSNWKLAQKIHKKNSSTFKSMNMKFVEKQFQNPIFAQLFILFLNNFQSNFEKENQDRIDRLNFIVALAIITEDMSELRSYKKLPWNKAVVRNIQKLFGDLKEIQTNTRQSDMGMQFSFEPEHAHMDGEDSSLTNKREQILLRINTNQSEL